MTREELRSFLKEAVERKLRELPGMEDDDDLFREGVRERFVRQLAEAQAGERGTSLDEGMAALDNE